MVLGFSRNRFGGVHNGMDIPSLRFLLDQRSRRSDAMVHIHSLRDSEQRLSVAIDSARLGVWDYNLLNRKFWWSKTLETIYGRTNDDFPGTYGQFFGCIHFDDQPLFNRAITRTIDEGNDYEIEFRIQWPDKTVRWVNTRGRLFFNSNSRAERIVGVVTDITDKKRAEEENSGPSLPQTRHDPVMTTV